VEVAAAALGLGFGLKSSGFCAATHAARDRTATRCATGAILIVVYYDKRRAVEVRSTRAAVTQPYYTDLYCRRQTSGTTVRRRSTVLERQSMQAEESSMRLPNGRCLAWVDV
jgi:hypothetical protein